VDSLDPFGRPWAPLKRRKGKPLVDTGALMRSFVRTSVTNNSVTVGTTVVSAALHQFGGTVQIPARSQQAYWSVNKGGSFRQHKGGGRFWNKGTANFARWVTIPAHQVTVPARPFLPEGELPETWKTEIVAAVINHLSSIIGESP
jgi:phage gpG-like protein